MDGAYDTHEDDTPDRVREKRPPGIFLELLLIVTVVCVVLFCGYVFDYWRAERMGRVYSRAVNDPSYRGYLFSEMQANAKPILCLIGGAVVCVGILAGLVIRRILRGRTE